MRNPAIIQMEIDASCLNEGEARIPKDGRAAFLAFGQCIFDNESALKRRAVYRHDPFAEV